MPTPSSQPNPKFDFTEPAKRSPPVPDAFKAPPPGSITNFSPPAPTPIFPQPINRPPAPATSAVPTTPSGRTGGRVAGSFKMPPGSGAAARGGAAVIGRRIPYVALAFIAYDAYQLACSLQLIPGSVCPRPDNPNPGAEPGQFSGGQCVCIRYRVIYVLTDSLNGQEFSRRTGVSLNGQIVSHRVVNDTTNSRVEWLCRGAIFGQCTSELVWVSSFESAPNPGYKVERVVVESITREDNQADNCGNPPPRPAPNRMPDQINNIINFNRNINFNINIPAPRPPAPQPRPAPRIVSPPSPLPDININFGDNYFGGGDTDYDFDIDFDFSPAPEGNFNDYPDIFNNFPPAPQPRTREPDPIPRVNPPPQPAPQPTPIPELPPPIPDTLPPDATDSDRYNFRIGRETLDKLYKANAEILEIQETLRNQNRILENIQSLLDFEVEGSQLIKRCDDVEVFYSYKDKVLKAISKQIQHVQAIEQTIINEICEVEKESIIASPDSWAVRLRVDVPQIALTFRLLGTRTYHKLTLPHPLNTNQISAPIIPSYKKGNWQGELVCIDNSKFRVNCESKIEAERVLNLALYFIDPVFLGQTPRLYFAERRGVTVSPGNMLATSALYFATGQQNLKPDWRVAFRYL